MKSLRETVKTRESCHLTHQMALKKQNKTKPLKKARNKNFLLRAQMYFYSLEGVCLFVCFSICSERHKATALTATSDTGVQDFPCLKIGKSSVWILSIGL